MSHRYSFDSDNPPYHDRPLLEEQPRYNSPPLSPAAHPDSSFNRLRAARRYSRERDAPAYGQVPIMTMNAPPAPPPHRDAEGRLWGRELGYANDPNITPGADNFGEQAAGGMVGLALGVADANARESGLEAMRNTPGYDPAMEVGGASSLEHTNWEDSPYTRPAPTQELSHTSLTPLDAAAFPPGMGTPQARSTSSPSPLSFNHEPYVDNPYNRYSRNMDPSLGVQDIDPNSIEDDGDDGLEYRQQNRGSVLSIGRKDDHVTPVAAGVAGGVATGGVLSVFGGLLKKKTSEQKGPEYDSVRDSTGNYNLGPEPEKSEWLKQQSLGNRKLRWIVGVLGVLLLLGGIAGGVVGGILSKKNHSSNASSSSSSSSSSGQSAAGDTAQNGDLNINSPEIQALMNNKNLHKVFPGIDYTPMNTQYPGCLTYPPSQNNVTRDLAVLSQLTNRVRLYGTDCNQTEMLLHSIDQLKLNGTVKVWLGVWLDNNSTTNDRQLAQMYDILNKYGTASFEGIIVGNEVLFREDMTAAELGEVITGVKTNLTSLDINLPIASSDLGDNWSSNPTLAAEVDILMANIHPFFAGVTAEVAAAWTWDFWQSHDLILKSDMTKNYISETGWPSAGGTDCGSATTCVNGSVAGIAEMNTYMDDWVCQSLTNGTQYFWFEAFDEPWKIIYDTPGEDWEDKWGLMDENRNLKDGVVIPSCGGQTVS